MGDTKSNRNKKEDKKNKINTYRSKSSLGPLQRSGLGPLASVDTRKCWAIPSCIEVEALQAYQGKNGVVLQESG